MLYQIHHLFTKYSAPCFIKDYKLLFDQSRTFWPDKLIVILWNKINVYYYSAGSYKFYSIVHDRKKVIWRSFGTCICQLELSGIVKLSFSLFKVILNWSLDMTKSLNSPLTLADLFFIVVQTLTVNQLIVNQHTEPIILERRQKLQKEAAVLTSYIKHNQDSIHTLMMICQRSVHRVKGQGQRQKFKDI